MQLKTILNHCHKIKGFVYTKIKWNCVEGEKILEINVRPRKGSKGRCGECCKPSPTYDTSREYRRFEFVPLWGIRVFLLYRMRRVSCPVHGVKTEDIPWADGKRRLCRVYQLFLANWAKRLSWGETARVFRTTWQNVYRSVEYVVRWGLKRRELSNVTAIGVDEVQYQRGHKYLTLVYQLNKGCRRLIWVGRKRTVKTLLRFFRMLGEERTQSLEYVCSDMWKPYLKVIRLKAGHAVHILDRYHVVANLNKALNEVRAGEARKMKDKGYEPILKHTRWCFLKRPENLTDKQKFKLKDVLQYNLKSVRAYLLKEAFQGFWEYTYPAWAGRYLDKWVARAMRSRLEPIKKVARQIRNHRELILNWFRANKEFSCGIVEGFNTRVKLTIRKACGFRTYNAIELALYHTLGELPQPEVTHRFW